jgi:Tfp pilus assembly protein PilZ
MASAAKDKRRHARMKPRGVLAHVSGGGKQFSSAVDNLSAGGLFLRTEEVVPRGTTLHLDLVKPGGRRALHVEGKVVGVLAPEEASSQRFLPGLGVEFAGVGTEEVERLEAFLQALGASGPDAIIPAWARPGGPPAQSRAEAETILRDIGGSLDGDGQPAAALGASSTLPRIAADPVQPDASRPIAAPEGGAPDDSDPARLMLQIRGLVFELSQANERLRMREAELVDLRAQLDRARARLEHSEAD